ncbi:MAG: UDP-N-acetylmuramoyl-L-alanyl-D-glutamate--2,6-diaminopimelate ligase [Nitrospiria bacterium]
MHQPMIEHLGTENIDIRDIAVDSRAVSPGTLFIAVEGTEKDGHDYIDAALQNGAAAVLLNEHANLHPKPESSVTLIPVPDTKAALRHLAPYFFNHPAKKLQLIGITGTNGKTTTAYLIDTLLTRAGKKSGLISTIAYRDGKREIKAKNTTPGLLDLQRTFAEMQKNRITHVVMEVSSHALHQGRVAGCTFKTAIFTNLTQDHLDYHGTMTAYFTEKKTLFEQTQGKWLINIDDPWGKQLQQSAPEKVWTYGIDTPADLSPLHYQSTLDGLSMTASSPAGAIEIRSSLSGRHNVYNILSAIGAGLLEGLTKEEISEGIAALENVPGRFEKIDSGQNFTVIVDYAHTADALERLLQALRHLKPNRILTLFGCGGDRDRGKRPKMGQAAATLSDQIILTSDNPRSEAPRAIIEEIEAGVLSHAKTRGHEVDYEMMTDRREAIHHIIRLAKAGDAVLIAGKGHETDQQIGGRTFPFDDREVARQALAARQNRA